MTIQLTTAGPVERAAHHLGIALLRWSEHRSARAVSGPSRSAARLAFAEQTALEARQRSWDRLAADAPRLR
jgi:hypothetical protein